MWWDEWALCPVYCTCGVLDVGVCVRSEVPCCVLWYLGSGSWARPSGSLRSRRSEACNYWSPPGPLWGRYGSSDACCSCTDAQENILKKSGMSAEHVCSAHVRVMHLLERARFKQAAGLFLEWTAWVKQSHWRWKEATWMCVSRQATQSKGTAASGGPPVLFRQQFGNKYGCDTSALTCHSSSHLGDLDVLS